MVLGKREVIERMFSEVWEQKRLPVLEEILSPSIKPEDDLFANLAPRRDYGVLIEVVHALIGPFDLTITQFMENEDWASAQFRIQSPGRDLSTPVDVEGMLMARFEDGLIAEITSQIDCFLLFEQLGQLPSDSMMACLSGQELTWK